MASLAGPRVDEVRLTRIIIPVRLGFTYFIHLGTARRTSPLSGRPPVFHGNSLSAFDFLLCPALYTISLHESPPIFASKNNLKTRLCQCPKAEFSEYSVNFYLILTKDRLSAPISQFATILLLLILFVAGEQVGSAFLFRFYLTILLYRRTIESGQAGRRIRY